MLCGAPLSWQSGWQLFLPGMAAGFCSTMVLNVNNMRDIETDGRTGKRTVAVRLGLCKARRYHILLASLVLLCWAVFWAAHRPAFLPGLAFALPLLRSVYLAARRPRDAANLNAQLRNTVIGSAICSTGMAVLCMAA